MRRLPNLLFEVASDGRWQIEDGRGLNLVAPPRQGFVVPSEYNHKLTYLNRIPSQTRYWMISIRDVSGRDLAREIGRPWILSRAETVRMVDCLSQCSETHVTVSSILKQQQMMLEIGRILFSGIRSEIILPRAVDARVQAVTRYVDEHLDENLSRNFLADLVQLSPTRFHYVFSSAIGVAPMQYVIDRRLSNARQLLAGTSFSVKEIARSVGYRDALQFSALFRRHLGESPATYRNHFRMERDQD